MFDLRKPSCNNFVNLNLRRYPFVLGDSMGELLDGMARFARRREQNPASKKWCNRKKKMQPPRFELGSNAWKAFVITTKLRKLRHSAWKITIIGMAYVMVGKDKYIRFKKNDQSAEIREKRPRGFSRTVKYLRRRESECGRRRGKNQLVPRTLTRTPVPPPRAS